MESKSVKTVVTGKSKWHFLMCWNWGLPHGGMLSWTVELNHYVTDVF